MIAGCCVRLASAGGSSVGLSLRRRAHYKLICPHFGSSIRNLSALYLPFRLIHMPAYPPPDVFATPLLITMICSFVGHYRMAATICRVGRHGVQYLSESWPSNFPLEALPHVARFCHEGSLASLRRTSLAVAEGTRAQWNSRLQRWYSNCIKHVERVRATHGERNRFQRAARARLRALTEDQDNELIQWDLRMATESVHHRNIFIGRCLSTGWVPPESVMPVIYR